MEEAMGKRSQFLAGSFACHLELGSFRTIECVDCSRVTANPDLPLTGTDAGRYNGLVHGPVSQEQEKGHVPDSHSCVLAPTGGRRPCGQREACARRGPQSRRLERK